MKSKNKKMVLGAALVVAIMALAGVGYATWSAQFTGTTDASGTKTVDGEHREVVRNCDAVVVDGILLGQGDSRQREALPK